MLDKAEKMRGKPNKNVVSKNFLSIEILISDINVGARITNKTPSPII